MEFDNIGGKKTKHSIFFFEKRQEKKKDIRFFHVSSQRQNNNIDVPRGKIERFKGFPRRFAHAQKYQNKDSSRRRRSRCDFGNSLFAFSDNRSQKHFDQIITDL